MSSNRIRRITKEIAETQSDIHSKVFLEPCNSDDLTHLRGTFTGPPDTPYEGGKYVIDIIITTEYPFRPPKMKFETKIWHPNISSQTGAICLDTLSTQWSPVLTIKSALLSLQALLESPEPKDPQDAEVASMLLKNPEEFNHVAREWAIKFAGASRNDKAESSADILNRESRAAGERESDKTAAYRGYNKDLVDRFCQMGFDVATVVNAFEEVGIDKMDGEDYQMEEEYMGDVTAKLFGEP